VRSRLLVVVIAALIGLVVGVQVSRRGEETSRLAAERPEDLARILAELNAEADELGRQVASLRVSLFRYQNSASLGDLALTDARRTLADLRVLAGVVPVEGPGISVSIVDPDGRVGWEAILDLVQELRDAGAEAIAVNGLRVIASAWFGPAEGGVTVGGRVVRAPYEVLAIGSPPDISEALGIPGGPIAVLESQPGVRVLIGEETNLSLPALRGETTFRYARPAP
jgi:uncharacterized protein YlxW (UPF0749 family)